MRSTVEGLVEADRGGTMDPRAWFYWYHMSEVPITAATICEDIR